MRKSYLCRSIVCLTAALPMHDRLLERIAALELTTRPELDRSQAKWDTFRRHRQARMHQNTTLGQLFAAPIDLTDPALPNESNTLWLIALIGNLCKNS